MSQGSCHAAGRKTLEAILGVMTRRVTTMVDATGTTTYTYSNGLLQSENGPWNGDTVSYAYNTARQRNQLVILQPTGNAWTNTYAIATDTPNVLNQAAGTYDARGNRISGTDSYTYDAENQLIQIEQASSWKLEFVYDGRQRLRIIRDFIFSGGSYMSQGETRLVYDGLVPIQERTSSSNPTVTYTRGTDLSGTFEGAGGIGGLLARSTHAGSNPFQPNSHAFYHADGNGNVTYLTRSDGSALGVYKYDPFGRTLATSGTLASANRMRFSSKPWVQSASGSSGYYAYGYRLYDPTSQRWLNRDPLEEQGGGNLYAYISNNSLNGTDPYGLRMRTAFPKACCDLDDAEKINDALKDLKKDYKYTQKYPSKGYIDNLRGDCNGARRALELIDNCPGPFTPQQLLQFQRIRDAVDEYCGGESPDADQ